ncbi:hypothetical protein ARMGADRAFT_1019483 [Armillaria gallica]|uniref:Uncharacterized protein n=1 Tax=Armillaria gallica TaxID=47427 RepID=A0A2H3CIE6_ARMGA|nr:hypothetical protein ARMGADRAFT_1019483 [Armillaria gallica]
MRFFPFTPFLYDTLFSSEPKPSNLSAITMQIPYQSIHGVIQPVRFSATIADFFESIAHRYDNPDRLSALQSCYVNRVEHYRGYGSIAHELVVVHILSGDDERVKAGNADSRVMVIERFEDSPGDESKTEQMRRSVRETKGNDTGNADLITFYGNLKDTGRLFEKYGLVQAFDVPRGTIDIILCASLAMTITESAKNYSLLHHMCLWFAALFFQTCKAICCLEGQCVIEEGPFYSRRGTVALVRLIGDNWTLLPGGRASMDTVLNEVQTGLLREGIAEDTIAQFENALLTDATLMEEEEEVPVAQMLFACTTLSRSVRASLEREVIAMKVRRRSLEEKEQRLKESEKKNKEREKKNEEREKKNEEREQKIKEGQSALDEGWAKLLDAIHDVEATGV